jgi:hypothetical protein
MSCRVSHHPLRYDDVHVVHRKSYLLHLPSYHLHDVCISVVSYNQATLLYNITDKGEIEGRKEGRKGGREKGRKGEREK